MSITRLDRRRPAGGEEGGGGGGGGAFRTFLTFDTCVAKKLSLDTIISILASTSHGGARTRRVRAYLARTVLLHTNNTDGLLHNRQPILFSWDDVGGGGGRGEVDTRTPTSMRSMRSSTKVSR